MIDLEIDKEKEEEELSLYEEMISKYEENKYFEENTIAIDYVRNVYAENNEEVRAYMLTGVRLISSTTESISDYLQSVVNICDSAIKNEIQPNGWQVFYVYKELLQLLLKKEYGFNYFRGQSHNHPILPGVMRDYVDLSYVKDFETIFHKMSYEFPDRINYTEFEDEGSISAREYDLSLLQHYGLKTALLDITKNPFIAMLFMLEDSIDDYKEPAFYLFKINESVGKGKTLFTEVRKNQINERILAQKGAFFNFEKVLLDVLDLKPIPYIKIVLRFNEDDYRNIIARDMKTYGEIKKDPSEKRHKKHFPDFEKNLERFNAELESMKSSKEESLKYINDELTRKLEEYYYTKEDMFPDFENRIMYLSKKYNKSTKNEIEYAQKEK